MTLKAVRVVSALNAAMRLGEYGYAQEMAVLFRTVDDFIGEIEFLLDGHQDGARQRELFVEKFFDEGLLSKEELLELQRGSARVSKKKVRTGQARYIGPGNPHTIGQMASAIDRVWGGYIHGAYPTIMELYNDTRQQFHVRGMDGTTRIGAYQRHHSYSVLGALQAGCSLALHLGLAQVWDELRRAAEEYQASDEYDRRPSKGES